MIMVSLALIGLVGGLITGISPCILPVLPVIFFSGTTGTADGAVAVEAKRDVSRPYRVIAGLVLSFSLVTLVGSALLSLLHLPQDAIRWVALVALVAIGLGLIFPRFEELLERPFARLPQKQICNPHQRFWPRSGAGCAVCSVRRPGAGRDRGGRRDGADRSAHRRAHPGVRRRRGGTAVVLRAGRPASRRAGQCFSTSSARDPRDGGGGDHPAGGGAGVQSAGRAAAALPGLHRVAAEQAGRTTSRFSSSSVASSTTRTQQLSNCDNASAQLQNCGQAPDLKGITAWLNTPGDTPVELHALHGKVVLIDFWAYSCINCQRAIPHVEGWYKAYHDSGFEVIGVHTPEYAFEKVTEQREKGCRRPGHHLSDRAGQQLLDVDELPKSVLAGRIPDRRQRHRSARQIRRGRLRRHREADPRAAHHRPTRSFAAAIGGRARHHPDGGPDAARRTSGWARMSNYAGSRWLRQGERRRSRIRRHCPPTPLRCRGRGHWTTRARPPTAIPRASN